MQVPDAQLAQMAAEISSLLRGRFSTDQTLEILKKFCQAYPERVPMVTSQNCRNVGDEISYRRSRHDVELQTGQVFFILAELGTHRGQPVVTATQPVILMPTGNYTRLNWEQIVGAQPSSNDRESGHAETPPSAQP